MGSAVTHFSVPECRPPFLILPVPHSLWPFPLLFMGTPHTVSLVVGVSTDTFLSQVQVSLHIE